MSSVMRFDTPGGVRDLAPDATPEEQERWLDTWHNAVRDMLGEGPFPGSAGPEPSPVDVNVGEFYNRLVTDVNRAGDRMLVWMGFPRGLLVAHRDDRPRAFELGDRRGVTERDTQIEYLEWRVTPGDGEGQIRKVTFTTETPEYWKELFKFDARRCAEVYSNLVGSTVSEADLADAAGDYNPLNRWNTADGIVHYIVNSPENTLPVAIDLAKGSVRFTGERHIRDNYELPQAFASTSADPRVQIDINTLVRKGLSVTCREPVGVYMAGWDDTGWTKPDGSPVGDYWRVVRGRHGAALRLEYEVPKAEGFLVSDIKIGGRPIRHGGHLAEHVTVVLGGLAGTRAA